MSHGRVIRRGKSHVGMTRGFGTSTTGWKYHVGTSHGRGTPPPRRCGTRGLARGHAAGDVTVVVVPRRRASSDATSVAAQRQFSSGRDASANAGGDIATVVPDAASRAPGGISAGVAPCRPASVDAASSAARRQFSSSHNATAAAAGDVAAAIVDDAANGICHGRRHYAKQRPARTSPRAAPAAHGGATVVAGPQQCFYE